MLRLKDNAFAKLTAFIIVQVCVVLIFFSAVIVMFNADYNLYFADREKAESTIVEGLAYRFNGEIYDSVYYDDGITGSGYVLEDAVMPAGVGYELHIADAGKNNVSGIDLSKNADSLKGHKNVHYAEMTHDDLSLTVYVKEVLGSGSDADKLYPDDMAMIYDFSVMLYGWRYAAVAVLLGSVVACIFLMAFLVITSGKKEENKTVIDRMPVDLAFTVMVCAAGIVITICCNAMPYTEFPDIMIAGMLYTCLIFAMSVCVTGFIWFFAAKIKRGDWWKSTVIYYLLKTCKKIMVKVLSLVIVIAKKLPLVWKTVLALALIMISNLIISVNMYWYGIAVLLWAAGAIVISAGVIYTALCMKRLKEGAGHLAAGDLDYKVNTKGLFLDFAEHAENLNHIGEGMTLAVEKMTKSERMKSELITNVSHDIKTPLTSIINYIDFLKHEESDDDKINEYVEVIDKHAKRLKKLTDDLVDASKASTGNVNINLEPCNIGVLIGQMLGEYQTKAEEAGITVISGIPDDDIEILADGRRLWRVFDNLLNNICKYSQPGTRVYVDLNISEESAEVIMRNTSRYELNIPAEELMGRFVRGDSSRHTEGSGLGLAIARDLTELQGGSFEIYIDGDLFKTIVKFNLLNL